ncbi:stalk domain-containing protein [Paenibacillus oleatilyticus]|uniref:Stalk domain-containing protein n=1 Tax=Paenibacillus oleatilyticus TaxID=2594886 RepID=A0ABV4UUI8_9BACL
MKKKIAVLSATLILMAGAVNASVLNGDYKGNPIVKVTSNGKPLEAGEVPAMIYDGNTLVPISLLRQLGTSVTWDGDAYQVDVKLPEPPAAPPASTDKSEETKQQNDIKKLKKYASVAELYLKLQTLGESLDSARTSIRLTADAMNAAKAEASSLISIAKTSYYKANETLTNLTKETTESVYEDFNKYGIDSSQIRFILAEYQGSARHYQLALDYLDKYVRDKKASDYNEYLINIGKADDSAKIAREKSSKGYAEWSKNVLNF